MSLNRKIAIAVGLIGLAAVYMLQRKIFFDPFADMIYDPYGNYYPEFSKTKYILSKLFRFVLNDGFAIAFIYGVFGPGKYVKFAALIFLIGLFILLPAYLIMIIFFYPETHSFLNHLHRLVLNPVLMMLLIPAFYAQKAKEKK